MSGTPFGPARYQGNRKPMDPTGPKKLASEVNGYQSGIGQGHGSGYVSNSGQSAPPIRSSQGIAGFQKPVAPATTIVGDFLPYTDAQDPNLPDYVKAMPDLKRRQWQAVWNSTYKRCRDRGGSDECESTAFKYANGVVKGSNKKDLDDIAQTMPWRLVEHQIPQIKASYKPTGGTQIQSCANCQWFVSPDACMLVSGDISPTGISDFWHQRMSDIDEDLGGHEVSPSEYQQVLEHAYEASGDKALGEDRTSGANTTKSSASKVLQSVAEYSPTGGNDAMSCANCFWYANGNSCHVVQGTIAPTGLSKYWTAPGVNDETEADNMAAGSNEKAYLDESTLGLLLDWAQENPEQVEFMLDNIGKEKDLGGLDPTHMGKPRSDRPMGKGPNGILNTADYLEPDNVCHCAACEAIDDNQYTASKEIGGLSWYLAKEKLTTSARNKLSRSQFAYTDEQGKGHFPIHDENHVRNALARLNQSPYGPKAKGKVCAAASRMGIDAPSCKSSGGSKSFKAFVKGLFSNECADCGPNDLASYSKGAVRTANICSIFKDTQGQLRVYFRASNNFKDRHHEIITEAAHKDYEHFVDTYEQYPEFWLWHTKGTRWGKADVVTYADGFLHVFGKVDPGCEDIARNVVKQRSAVSHGFLTFNQKDNIISKYRSWEISPLPRGAEANQWFTGVDVVKELKVGIPEVKKAWMQELGVPAEMIKAIEQESISAKGFLDDLGVDSKAIDKPRAEGGVAGQAKRKRPDQLHTAVGEDDDDNDTEPDDDRDDAPTRSGPDKAHTGGKSFTKKELAMGLLAMSNRIKALEEKLDVRQKQAEQTPQSDEDIYLASLQKAARSFSPTRKDAGNELDPKVANELEQILGRPVAPGAEEKPNSWFGEIVGAVERMGG